MSKPFKEEHPLGKSKCKEDPVDQNTKETLSIRWIAIKPCETCRDESFNALHTNLFQWLFQNIHKPSLVLLSFRKQGVDTCGIRKKLCSCWRLSWFQKAFLVPITYERFGILSTMFFFLPSFSRFWVSAFLFDCLWLISRFHRFLFSLENLILYRKT